MGALPGRGLAGGRMLRHVRHPLRGASRPASHSAVGAVSRRLPTAEGFPAPGSVQPLRAAAPGARGDSGRAGRDGRAGHRAGIRRAPGGDAAAAAYRREDRRVAAMATKKRTVEVELSTSGLDSQGRPTRRALVTDEQGNISTLEAPPAGEHGVSGAWAGEPELSGEHMLINIGPQHPATHGVLRLVLELDGETVVRCIPHVGYLHCGFEKIGEYRQYNQIIPWTDREDYLNSIGNNCAFALGAERMFGIDITPRCTVLRVIAMELSRIISHLVWLGTTCIDIGAFTLFLWSFQERENVYNLLESWVGARLTTSATRVGGMAADILDGWMDGLR